MTACESGRRSVRFLELMNRRRRAQSDSYRSRALRQSAMIAAILVSIISPASRAAQSESKRNIVLLNAPVVGNDVGGGLLVQELARQAVLIAVRDELGLPTRDAMLMERLPADAKTESAPLDVTVSAEGKQGLVIRILRSHPTRPVLLKAFRLKAQDRATIASLATQLEALSRTEVVTVLKQNGFPGREPVESTNAENIQADVKPLKPSGCLPHYAAIRALHAEMRSSGESPVLLAELSRSYVHLGTLTEVHWNPMHKVFKARALLYAERLLARAPDTLAYRTRSYVRAFIGLQQGALDDLDALRKLYAEQAGTDPLPAEVDVIDAYCRGDAKRLARAADTGEEQYLARSLHLLAAEATQIYALRFKAAERVLEMDSNSVRAIEAMFPEAPLGVKKHCSAIAPKLFSQAVYQDVALVADLPKAIRELVAAPPADRDLEPAHRVKLMESLHNASATEADISEPSLSVASHLIREINFLQAWRQLDVERFALSINADETLKRVQPLVQGHPYKAFLDCHVWDPQAAVPAIKALAERANISHVEAIEEPMLRLLESFGVDQIQVLANVSLSHNDLLFRDLIDWTRRGPSPAVRQRAAQRLREISPNMSATIIASIAYDWEYAAPRAEEWEKAYVEDPAVQDALALKYVALEKLDDAERCLKRRIEAVPDQEAYLRLASLYQGKGDDAGWVKTLIKSLDVPSYGLENAHTRVTLAYHFMKNKDFETARKYADAAAESWAGWAMSCAADCHEQMGDWDGTELYVRRTAERYEILNYKWYFWCCRTGKGDRPAARALMQKRLNAFETSQDLDDRGRLALYCYTEGKKERSLEILRENFTVSQDPSDGLQAALHADELDKIKLRDILLEESLRAARLKGSQLADLIHDFRKALLADAPIPFDLKVNQWRMHLLPAGEATEWSYFLGKFLLLRGLEEDAIRHIQWAAASPSYDRTAATYAGLALQAAHRERGPLRTSEWEGELGRALDLVANAYRSAQNGDIKAVDRLLEKALEIEANSIDALFARASIYRAKRWFADAIEDLTLCIEQLPNSADFALLRANCHEQLSDPDAAIADYNRATAIDPHQHRSYVALASLLATCADEDVRDGKKAVELARRCMNADDEIAPWNQHFVLSTALAEAGEFAEAIQHGEEALKLAPKEVKPTIGQILDLYRNGTPFHRRR